MSNKHLHTKMLIISNNVLSPTKNNGKTLLSFIDGVDKNNIRQLYFHGEKPSIEGYSYYQLSDNDVLHGLFSREKRGRIWSNFQASQSNSASVSSSIKIKPSSFSRIARDILWKGHWKSKKLLQWLDEFAPDTVFFVAGDSCFSYNIVDFVVKRFGAKLVTYITDDYIMPRKKELFFDKIKRLRVRNKMLSCISKSDEYFTISSLMQKTYRELTGKSSEIIMNMTPPLYEASVAAESLCADRKVMVYAGSLYYGRDGVVGAIADAIALYNNNKNPEQKPVQINVYSNQAPDENQKKIFERNDCCAFCGSLTFDELKIVLNKADILLFVESFDEQMQEKVKYSLSTKVPEYMSVRKPILAVGPKQVGSMDYLEDVAFCANSKQEIYRVVTDMLSSEKEQLTKIQNALAKYNSNHDIDKQHKMFWDKCYGNKEEVC